MPVKTELVGVWSKGSGLVMTQKFIWERRGNLDGLELTCATEKEQTIRFAMDYMCHKTVLSLYKQDPPWVYLEEGDQSEVNAVGGYTHRVWEELTAELNVT